ncbi:hypothetical protein EMCRGX_G017344 [Ephydatia muelleri]
MPRCFPISYIMSMHPRKELIVATEEHFELVVPMLATSPLNLSGATWRLESVSAGENTCIVDRIRCWGVDNLEIHLEIATTFVTTQLKPHLITWNRSIMPGECAFLHIKSLKQFCEQM